MLKQIAILFVLPLSMFAACGGDDDGGTGGGGDDGAAGDGPSGCATGGKGKVVVEIEGLPSGVLAEISVVGPDGTSRVSEGGTLEDMGSGPYTVTAARTTDTDPIVRTVFDPASIEPAEFCLKADGSETVTVTYEDIPSSNKLWATNAGDHAVCAFASATLAESGAPDATVNFDGAAGNEVAFDRDGNFWSIGSTLAAPPIVRFPAAVLGTSGPKEPDRGIVVTGVECIPAIWAIAFDPSGNLWVSTCGNRVVRLAAADLEGDGELTPDVAISGVTDNGNLAFDSAGNLWVISEGAIARFDESRLGADDSDPPDLLLTGSDPDTTNPLGAADLAFDVSGNLWVTDFGGNLVYMLEAAALDGTGDTEVTASVRISIGVTALIERPAFDESGGLWIGLGGGGIGRLSPEQLSASTSPGDPTTPEVLITSADLGSVGRVGFFPAAADLPLYHALP